MQFHGTCWPETPANMTIYLKCPSIFFDHLYGKSCENFFNVEVYSFHYYNWNVLILCGEFFGINIFSLIRISNCYAASRIIRHIHYQFKRLGSACLNVIV